MMMMMIQHFSNSRVKNTLRPSLLVIPHDYRDRWVEECYLQGKNTSGLWPRILKGHTFRMVYPHPWLGPLARRSHSNSSLTSDTR